MPIVLVVDDLSSDRYIAGGLLSIDDEISVEYANNGVEALEKIHVQTPDLVLTDLQMPEMDGLELVGRIQKVHPLIPTILMTARGSESHAFQALRRGAASYVPKKFLNSQLLETVHRTLAATSPDRTYAKLMMRVSEMTFVLENDLELISSLVSHLRQSVRQRRICDESDAIRVATCLDEALLNAYYHGNLEVDSTLRTEEGDRFHKLAGKRLATSAYADRRISVTARYSPADATFIIRAEGPGFNPDDLPDPTDPEYLERPSGRGLMLIRNFMDVVTFNETCNEITLVKHKSQRTQVVE